jgi:hypothetical protein
MQWFEQPVVNGLAPHRLRQTLHGPGGSCPPRGYAAINADLEQDFANLFTAQAIAQCAANMQQSSWGRLSAEIMAKFIMLRSLSDKPSRPQTWPQQYSVTSSCNGWVKSSAFWIERLT